MFKYATIYDSVFAPSGMATASYWDGAGNRTFEHIAGTREQVRDELLKRGWKYDTSGPASYILWRLEDAR